MNKMSLLRYKEINSQATSTLNYDFALLTNIFSMKSTKEYWHYHVLVSLLITVVYWMFIAARNLMQLDLQTHVLDRKLLKSMHSKLYPCRIILK